LEKLPQFVTRDRELERGHEAATEKLAEHRWHWTLDESNPDRVSIREYARSVSRDEKTIRRMTSGYAAWLRRPEAAARPGMPVSLTDFIMQANLGADRAEAAEAVAAATGRAFTTVAKHHRPEVREVLATAQDRAARRGTTVSEELPRVAQSREDARQAARRERHDRRENRTFFLVEVEGHLGAAIRQLRDALDLVRDADFSEEEVEQLEDTLAKLKTFVRLIDVRMTGNTGVDWDAEFAAIMEGA